MGTVREGGREMVPGRIHGGGLHRFTARVIRAEMRSPRIHGIEHEVSLLQFTCGPSRWRFGPEEPFVTLMPVGLPPRVRWPIRG